MYAHMNDTTFTTEFGIWFLLISLFLPRFCLFFWWVCGNLPHNTTPFVVDLLTSIFIPRVLILVWIFQAGGFNIWFYLHLVALIIAWTINFLRVASKPNKK